MVELERLLEQKSQEHEDIGSQLDHVLADIKVVSLEKAQTRNKINNVENEARDIQR